MTGLDVRWETHPEVDEEQNTVMIVHFRPDKKPKSQAEWYHLLGNYCHTMEKLINCPLEAEAEQEAPATQRIAIVDEKAQEAEARALFRYYERRAPEDDEDE